MDFNDYIDFVNLKGVVPNDGASFSPIAPGDYELEITDAKRTTTKKTNKPMLVIEFTVINEGADKNKTARGWYVLDNSSAFSLGRLAALLTASGVPFDENGFSLAGLVGARIGGTISHEAYSDMDATGQSIEKTSVRVTCERALMASPKAANIPAGVRTRSNGGGVQSRPVASR